MDDVRSRLRAPRGAALGLRQLQERATWGFARIVGYLAESVDSAEWASLSPEDIGDAAYDIYRLAAQRTRLTTQYRAVLEDSAQWSRLCARLAAFRDGEAPREPRPLGPEDLPARGWVSRRPVGVGLLVGVVVLHQCLFGYMDTGRERVKLLAVALVLASLALAWYLWGPDLSSSRGIADGRQGASVDGDSETEDDGGSRNSAGTASSELDRLR